MECLLVRYGSQWPTVSSVGQIYEEAICIEKLPAVIAPLFARDFHGFSANAFGRSFICNYVDEL